MGQVFPDRNRPANPRIGCLTGVGWVTGHVDRAKLIHLLDGQKCPIARISVGAVEDGLEVKMAARRGSGGTYPGNNFPHPHGVALLDSDRLQMVVRGDETVSVIDFHPVAAAPRVPPDGPHHTGVGRVHPGAAGRGEVLAPVEFACEPGEGAGAHPEGGRGH